MILTTIETFKTDEDGFLIIVVRITDQNKNIVFALDPWKFGYIDFDENTGTFKQLKNELGIPTIKFHRIEKKEAAELLRQNYDIANEVGMEIPEIALNWLEKLGVLKLKRSSSLYKCFNCRENDLTNEENEEILKVAKKEKDLGKIGGKEEEQYFYVCENCKQKMHKAHTQERK